MKKSISIMTLILMTIATTFSQSAEKRYKDLPDGLYAEIQTSAGNILVFLEFQKTPLTVANFVGLAEGTIQNTAKPIGTPFYDSLTFHRVVPDFVIQGGDPKGDGTGGPGYSFKDEFFSDLKHDKAGVLAMANSGANTNGSQFYITLKATPWLDGHYNIFGHVVQGQDVVSAIKQGDKINHVEVFAVGKDAKKFDAAKVFSDFEKQGAVKRNG